MRFTLALLAAFAAVPGTSAQRVLSISFGKHTNNPTLRRRSTHSQELNNNLTGGGYYADVFIGTPPQPVSLVLDTGSSDVWVLDNNANICRSVKLQAYYGYCVSTYNPSKSSTYQMVGEDSFNIKYLDGSAAAGNYIKDTFTIGGANITNLQMGLAENTNINSGLLGVGFSANVASDVKYPNIMDLFEEQGLIATQAYSLYLDDLYAETGTILFGGLDTEKYIGELKAVPILPDTTTKNYTSFSVALSSLTMTADNGTVTNFTQAVIPAILDSGTTLTYLPTSMANRIITAFGAVDDTSPDGTGLVYVNCDYLSSNKNLTFDFQFGGSDGPIIRVPIDELILDNVKGYVEIGLVVPDLPFDNVCSFGIQGSPGLYLLGDTFLRSAYVVYDLSNKQIALAPANLNSTRSNIVEITEESGIPDVTGVASQVSAEQTATVLPGTDAGGSLTATATATATVTPTTTGSSSSTEISGNSGIKSVPAPNWEAAAVAAMAGVFSLVGAGVLVL
ncbi:aspartic peptidase domain-containing protein [Biscogniauxia mediterranea]|nr:aspartic peptidase domain-containing protein [Biscogniauxia mediterranea]